MLFNSWSFLFLFLPITMIGFQLLGRSPRACLLWLTAGSLIFYGWPYPEYLALIGSSIAFNYALGLLLARNARG